MIHNISIDLNHNFTPANELVNTIASRNTDKTMMLHHLKTDWPVVIHSMESMVDYIPASIRYKKSPFIHQLYERVLLKHSSLLNEEYSDVKRHEITMEELIESSISLSGQFMLEGDESTWHISHMTSASMWIHRQQKPIKVSKSIIEFKHKDVFDQLLYSVTSDSQKTKLGILR